MVRITRKDCKRLFDMKTIDGNVKTLWWAPNIAFEEIEETLENDWDLTFYDDVTDFIDCIIDGAIEIDDSVEYVMVYDRAVSDNFVVEVRKEDF